MTSEKPPTVIKKYANRRLYNTGTSAYVTLEDLASMVKRGEDFVVYDAKGGEEITRSVLAQIIFEQEGKNGQSLLPVSFLRQLIRFYGDSIQMLVPSYLEFSLDKLTKEKGDFSATFGANPLTGAMMANPMAEAARPIFAQIEEQTRQNVALFRQALTMFTPVVGAMGDPAVPKSDNRPVVPERPAPEPDTPDFVRVEPPVGEARGELDDMQRQLEQLQRRMETMAIKA